MLSFLLGISFSFLVSVVYVRSAPRSSSSMVAFVALLLGYGIFHLYPLDAVLPSLGFQRRRATDRQQLERRLGRILAESIVLVVAMFTFGRRVALVAPEPLTVSPKVTRAFPDYTAHGRPQELPLPAGEGLPGHVAQRRGEQDAPGVRRSPGLPWIHDLVRQPRPAHPGRLQHRVLAAMVGSSVSCSTPG